MGARRTIIGGVLTVALAFGGACEKSSTGRNSGQSGAGKSVSADSGTGVAEALATDTQDSVAIHVFRHEGITLTVPEGWTEQNVTPSPMAPKAFYRLEGNEKEDIASASVRVTYFPRMKGMDEANIDRWLGQVRREDGQPCTREDAKITTTDLTNVRLTVVDVSGSLSSDMGGNGTVVAGQRMIVAIVDHPNGPHFVKVTGPSETVAKWAASVHAFLKSARVEP